MELKFLRNYPSNKIGVCGLRCPSDYHPSEKLINTYVQYLELTKWYIDK